MSDQIVYVCECGTVESKYPYRSWRNCDVTQICPACGQPVRAVNITELEEENAALKAEVERLRKVEVAADWWHRNSKAACCQHTARMVLCGEVGHWVVQLISADESEASDES